MEEFESRRSMEEPGDGFGVYLSTEDVGDMPVLTTEELEANAKARAERKEQQWQSMFGVRVKSTRPRETKPERMQNAARLLAQKRLRRHPCMPADPDIADKSWLSVDTGAWMPPVSCAFRGCCWWGGR